MLYVWLSPNLLTWLGGCHVVRRLYQNPSKVNTFAVIIHVLIKALKKFFQILSTYTQLEFWGKFQPQNPKKNFCVGSKTVPPYTSFGIGAPPFLVQVIPKLVQGGQVLVCPIPVLEIHLLNFDNHPILKMYNLLLLFLFFWPYPIMGFELGFRLSLEIKQSPKYLPNNLQIVS